MVLVLTLKPNASLKKPKNKCAKTSWLWKKWKSHGNRNLPSRGTKRKKRSKRSAKKRRPKQAADHRFST